MPLTLEQQLESLSLSNSYLIAVLSRIVTVSNLRHDVISERVNDLAKEALLAEGVEISKRLAGG